MDSPQTFWDLFRGSWRKLIPEYKPSWNDPRKWTSHWTELIKQAAEASCHGLAAKLGKEVQVGREGYGRLDVHAICTKSGELFVAFESELAPWGRKGDWRQEFRSLCERRATLSVLSGTFTPGAGYQCTTFLQQKIQHLAAPYGSGDFCLIFGPGPFDSDPDQAWLAYSLGPDMRLRHLTSAKPLRPVYILQDREDIEE